MVQNGLTRETLVYMSIPLFYGLEDDEERFLHRRMGNLAQEIQAARRFSVSASLRFKKIDLMPLQNPWEIIVAGRTWEDILKGPIRKDMATQCDGSMIDRAYDNYTVQEEETSDDDSVTPDSDYEAAPRWGDSDFSDDDF